MVKEYDLVVLGGGTGGYVGAIRAAQLGMTVAIVEKEKLGGTCLHKGCIPSKALLKSAEMYRQVKHVDQFGVQVSDLSFDFTQMQERKEENVNTLHQGIQALMKKNKIDVYEGEGAVLAASIFSPIPGTVSVKLHDEADNLMLNPKQLLISTGSSPKALKGLPFDGEKIIHSDHILQLTELPESIIIVGGGVIGIEWASLLTDLDVKVTVVEGSQSILPTEDRDVQVYVKKQLEKRGVSFYTNVDLSEGDIDVDDEVTMTMVQNEETIDLSAEKMLVSIGRSPNIEQIGLSNTSIEYDQHGIKTNEYYQTEESHIYAIGDCIGGMQLAHVASKEAIIAVEHMNEENPNVLLEEHVPTCVYSYPEISKIGLTEAEVKKAGYQYVTSKFPYQAIGKSHVNGDTNGFCKVIIDKETDDLLGIHLVGENATDLIGEASLAKLLDASGWELTQTIHAHPSLSEVFSEAVLASKNKPIHL
ncbi:MAG TPA: dihydrolipoyl dehydrogenase [Pseudogracilibacillus sp.]|nr:dihydrolipoyl dehydrogenase [Pseudogracilibacillus sp.]